jgi:hypothetical protein
MSIKIRRYWEAEYYNGTIINENQMEWKKIPKVNMKRLTLFYDGRQWDLIEKQAYFQKKRASMVPGISESFQVETRSVGYFEGAQKVTYTVDENTGVMKMTVKDIV